MPTSPPSTSLPLGHPLPLDEHACSVSLPTWCSVVGYEEGAQEVTQKMACGYPRFVYHPYIIQLMNAALEIDRDRNKTDGEFDCIVLPSRSSALRCHDFLVKACGYLDGRAVSPRLAGDDNHISHLVGDYRIQLFSEDNAIDSFEKEECYNANSPIRVLDFGAADVHAVIFPAQTAFAIEAKSYWQHTGEVLSSRRAEVALAKLGLCETCHSKEGSEGLKRVTSAFFENEENEGWATCKHTQKPHLALFSSEGDSSSPIDAFTGIQERIASIVQSPSSSVFLTPSGMASIYAALRSARRKELKRNANGQGGTSIVYGFPYLDTLKMCSRPELVPDGVEFFGHGDESDLKNFEQMLQQKRDQNGGHAGVSALITEFPSNPLLNCPDLYKLRALADEYHFALIVDDTIGNFANVDLIQNGLADAVCTSLTKLFNGRGDAMAGSVVTNPNTECGRWMQEDMTENHLDHEGLWAGDAIAVFKNSEDFLERSSKINETTEALADWLKEREEISTIYYPKYTCPTGYNLVLRQDDCDGRHTPGYGGLFSIILDHHVCVRTFYDKINLSKGPSLGTNFSLACPYTLLAHYHELDFAMTYGVQPNLIRFAIGLEDLETMKGKFEAAFKESRLHPKLPNVTARAEQKRAYCTISDVRCSSQIRNMGPRGLNKYNFGTSIGFGLETYSSSVWKSRRSFATVPQSKIHQLDLRFLGTFGKETMRRNSTLIRCAASSLLRRRL